ncbi:PREDICTED: 28S ribosomal protein S36, mitochondrial [Haliaeetus leucocephalus]|nr:PREDICTED: 28S ribosomal protein S36, mitochondrial [Haliaeetus leucocephalus]
MGSAWARGGSGSEQGKLQAASHRSHPCGPLPRYQKKPRAAGTHNRRARPRLAAERRNADGEEEARDWLERRRTRRKQSPAALPRAARGIFEGEAMKPMQLRDQIKQQLAEYSTAADARQVICCDYVKNQNKIKKYVIADIEDWERRMEEVTVSLQNKTLALQRIQLTFALRNKMKQNDDDDSRLITETVKRIVALSQRIIKCQQVVKPHTPLIKFPDRKSSPRPKIQESLQASVPSLHASKAQDSVGGRSPAFQSISPVSRVQGTPDTSELARTLPQKYRRKLMSDEEIEYIQRGGPE